LKVSLFFGTIWTSVHRPPLLRRYQHEGARLYILFFISDIGQSCRSRPSRSMFFLLCYPARSDIFSSPLSEFACFDASFLILKARDARSSSAFFRPAGSPPFSSGGEEKAGTPLFTPSRCQSRPIFPFLPSEVGLCDSAFGEVRLFRTSGPIPHVRTVPFPFSP